MKCDFCDSEQARIIHISRSYGKNEELFVIENIPLISCSQCGESYFTAETLHQIETIKKQKNKFSVTRPIPVASL